MNRERDLLKNMFQRIPQNIGICFFSGLIIGLLTHLYMLTHKLPNWDDINNLSGFGSGVDYGRWFLQYVRPLMGWWSVPALNGVLTIILLSIAACFVVATLQLQTRTSSILVPVMMVTFPAVTSLMTFMFTANTYAVGVLLACMGAYYCRKNRFGYVIGSILLILSLGIYQSYICLGAAILVLALVLELFEGNDIKKTFVRGIQCLVTLAVTMGVYIVLVKIFAHGYLSTDRGVDTMGQLSITYLPRLIMRAYKRITEYFLIKPYSFISPFFRIVNVVCCVLIIVTLVLLLILKKYRKEYVRVLFILVLAMMVPLALGSIYILAPETQDASMLMLYQYFFIYVMLIAFGEKLAVEIKGSRLLDKATYFVYISTVCAVLIVGYLQYMLANEAYFRMELAFDRAYAYYNRLIDNVERQEDFHYGDQIAILGSFFETPLPMASAALNEDKFKDLSGIAMENGMLTEGVRSNFICTYLGIAISQLTEEESNNIKNTETYDQMPLYPEKGSIQKIGDKWVVKLADDEKYAEIY